MLAKLSNFLNRYERIIPVLLFIVFLAVSIPGVNWGVPALWNPDELVWRVANALNGELVFDETEPDFNYPSLPKYIMFGIGKIVYMLGYSRSEFIIAARVFSVLLGAFAAVLVYYLARAAGAKVSTSGLAGLLYIAAGLAATNARFAHNDLYLQFFSMLCVYFAVKYHLTGMRYWIYASFFAVGLAASSKYTGGSLLLVPLFTLIMMNWNELKKNWFQSLETLFISAVLCFGGYALGTPKALLWMVYYFKRVIPALKNYPLYSTGSGTVIGLYGQWGVFEQGVGIFAYYLFIGCIVWFMGRLILRKAGKFFMEEKQAQVITILLVTVIIFDLPFLISVNYIPRFFIPFVPFLSVLAAIFIAEIYELIKRQGWRFAHAGVTAFLFIGIAYSLLRLVSIALLFANDARMPAGQFIAGLSGENKTIEYTLYPPVINKDQFSKARNYPIYFLKYPNEVVPSGGRFEYNQGEQGLLDRDVDYLVIDTLTYSRLYNDSICGTNPVECDFFKRLIAGEISSFRLVEEFNYSLPPYLPEISIAAVNPEVRIYERVR